MHTSELKVSEMTKRATEQSVPPELLLEPGIVDQGRRQRPAQGAALFDLFLHPAQTYMEDVFCAPILALEALGDSVHLHKVWLVTSKMGMMIGPVSIKWAH